jgi:hypothetical protein
MNPRKLLILLAVMIWPCLVFGSTEAASILYSCDNPYPDSCEYPDTCCVIPSEDCPWELNALDLTYLISFFRGGPPPIIFSKFDVNCDCILDGQDVTFLINYFQHGGPPPLCCFYQCQYHPQNGAIGNLVWDDANHNGIQDLDESGVADVEVQLTDCSDPPIVLLTNTTNVAGYYSFDTLDAGSYRVHFMLPAGYEFTLKDQGDNDAIDSDADRNTGFTDCFEISSNQSDLSRDAGMYQESQEEGCVWQLAWWKNHAGFRPQPDSVSQYLPLWLGLADSANSINVADNDIAIEILRIRGEYGHPFNGITRLYAQLLTARLNIAHGAGDENIAATMETADTYLASHDWNDWNGLGRGDKQQILGWVGLLVNYNNGFPGPSRCQEFDEMQR